MKYKLLAGVILITQCCAAGQAMADGNTSGEVAELKAMVKELSERVIALESRLREQQSASASAPAPVPASHGPPVQLAANQTQSCTAKAAKTAKPVVTSDNDNVKLKISGQVNRAMLFADNGNQSKFFHVDNDNVSTRFRFQGEARVNEDFMAGAQIIMQVESNSSADVDIIREKDSGSVITDRQLEVYFDSKRFGRLWLGKGETASDTTNEIDLSGTGVVADAVSGIEEFAGGISFFNRKDPDEPGPRVKTVFANFDGLDLKNRVRYDTPSFYGFTLGASHADTDSYDGAIKFAGEFAGQKVQAAFAAARDYPSFAQYNSSASVLFSCGISLSGAWGIRGFRGIDKLERENADLIWGKLGFQHQWFEIGTTALAADIGRVRNLDESGDRAKAWGVFLVQNIDIIATEIFWGARWHRLSRRKADFHTIGASMVGARIKF
ncbi:MAG: porin [Pseudomonadota bacterium]